MGQTRIDMTSGAILPKLLTFSIPLILSSVLQLLFNAADIIVVGRFAGENSLAAVGSTSSLINLLVNLFIGLSVGCNVVAANFLGAGKKEELSRTVHTAMILSVVGGVVLTVLGVCFSRRILILMASPENVLPLSTVYLKIFFGGITASVVYNFGASLLRAKGDTRRPLYILFIAGLINVVLNLFFVLCFRLDVAGVALATVLSQTFSAVCVVLILVREKDDFRLDVAKLRIDGDILARIVRIGVPAGFQGILFSFSNMIIQSSVNSFGTVFVAGNSAAQSIEGFVYISMNSFAQGALTFSGQNRGAHKFGRVRRVVLLSECVVVAVGLVLGVTGLLFGRSLLGIYSDNADVIEAGMVRLRVILLTYFTCGMMDCMASAIRGIGYSVLPMIVTLVGACGLRIAYILTVFQIPRFHSFRSIFYSYPASWIVTFVFLTASFLYVMRKIER